MTAMEIRDLVIKVDGYPIVNGLTLTVEEGEQVGIIGNHQDALVVVNTLSGLTLPEGGEIWIYNLPPRQALQRGLINYVNQSSVQVDTFPNPVLLLTQATSPQAYVNIIVHPMSHIEVFNEPIHKNYKFINLALGRRDKSL